MASKNKSNGYSVPRKTSVKRQAEETPARPTPSQEEIRGRAYEIYLEREGHAGDALDDWFRAERELQKVALFTRDWNRLQDQVAPIPGVEIAVPNAEERRRSSQ